MWRFLARLLVGSRDVKFTSLFSKSKLSKFSRVHSLLRGTKKGHSLLRDKDGSRQTKNGFFNRDTSQSERISDHRLTKSIANNLKKEIKFSEIKNYRLTKATKFQTLTKVSKTHSGNELFRFKSDFNRARSGIDKTNIVAKTLDKTIDRLKIIDTNFTKLTSNIQKIDNRITTSEKNLQSIISKFNEKQKRQEHILKTQQRKHYRELQTIISSTKTKNAADEIRPNRKNDFSSNENSLNNAFSGINSSNSFMTLFYAKMLAKLSESLGILNKANPQTLKANIITKHTKEIDSLNKNAKFEGISNLGLERHKIYLENEKFKGLIANTKDNKEIQRLKKQHAENIKTIKNKYDSLIASDKLKKQHLPETPMPYNMPGGRLGNLKSSHKLKKKLPKIKLPKYMPTGRLPDGSLIKSHKHYSRPPGMMHLGGPKHAMLPAGGTPTHPAYENQFKSFPYFRQKPDLTIENKITRLRIEREKSKFLQYGQMPSGFEFMPGNQGKLGNPAAVAARGAMPLSGGGTSSGFSGYSGGYSSPTSGVSSGVYSNPANYTTSGGTTNGVIDPHAGEMLKDPLDYPMPYFIHHPNFKGFSKTRKQNQISSSLSNAYLGVGNPLSKQRISLGAGKLTRAQKIHIYATSLAEVGDKANDAALANIMESAYNRGVTEGDKSIMSNFTSAYYSPLRKKSDPQGYHNYLNYKRQLEKDPKFFKRLDNIHNQVAAGSNYSNYATQNSSAGVASNAHKYQTVTNTTNTGETMSRKDRRIGGSRYGRGVIKRERKWYVQTKKAMENWKKQVQKKQSQISKSTKANVNDPIGSLKNKMRRDRNYRHSSAALQTGSGRIFNYGRTSQGLKESGGAGHNIVKINLKNGMYARVNRSAAKDYTGYLNELIDRGYDLRRASKSNYVESFVNRSVTGGRGKSAHAFGFAVDINPKFNPYHGHGKTDLPPNAMYLAMKYGLAPLHSDPMHIERVSPQKRKAYAKYLIENGWVDKKDPVILRRIKEGMFTQKEISSLKQPPGAFKSGKSKNIQPPWTSLEKPPTKSEIDAAMKGGTIDFDYDPNQPGAKAATDYIIKKGGNPVGYIEGGGGGAQWNETTRDLTSPKGQDYLKNRIKQLTDKNYKAIHIDNLDNIKDPDKMKKIFDDVKKYSGGKLNIVTKNNPGVFSDMFQKYPDTKNQVEFSYVENASSENPADVKSLTAQIPNTFGVEFQKTIDPTQARTVDQVKKDQVTKKLGLAGTFVMPSEKAIPGQPGTGFSSRNAQYISDNSPATPPNATSQSSKKELKLSPSVADIHASTQAGGAAAASGVSRTPPSPAQGAAAASGVSRTEPSPPSPAQGAAAAAGRTRHTEPKQSTPKDTPKKTSESSPSSSTSSSSSSDSGNAAQSSNQPSNYTPTSFPRNNPESQRESQGSGGYGSFGRCFV